MAVSSNLLTNSLALKYKIGVDATGKDVFKEQTFKNISSTATDDELMSAADGVEKLLDFAVGSVKKEQTFILIKE